MTDVTIALICGLFVGFVSGMGVAAMLAVTCILKWDKEDNDQ